MNLTFTGLCIIKSKQDALFLNLFGKEFYMFWTDLLSIIRSLILYSQQLVFVILVMLPSASEVRMELA